MMHGHGKSDRRVVPTKPPHKDHGMTPTSAPGKSSAPQTSRRRSAEAVEGRRLAKGNPRQRTMLRTQRRVRMPRELERIRQAANTSALAS